MALEQRAHGLNSHLSLQAVDHGGYARLQSFEVAEREARVEGHSKLQQQIRDSSEALEALLGGVAAKLEASMVQAHADHVSDCLALHASMQHVEQQLQRQIAEASRMDLQLGEVLSVPLLQGPLRNVRLGAS